jgi:T-complex protein 1 subunit delta
MIPGGGAPEIELSQKLEEYARGLKGVDSMITRAFADALEIIPYTLAENAGLNPIQIVTDLRNRHSLGHKNAGISIKRGAINDDIT